MFQIKYSDQIDKLFSNSSKLRPLNDLRCNMQEKYGWEELLSDFELTSKV